MENLEFGKVEFYLTSELQKSRTGKHSFWVKIGWVQSKPIEVEVLPNNTHTLIIEFSEITFLNFFKKWFTLV